MNDSLESPPKPQRYWFSRASPAPIKKYLQSYSSLIQLRERRYSIKDLMEGSSKIQPWHSLILQKGYQLPEKFHWLMLTRLNLELFKQAPHLKLPVWHVHPIDESLWTYTVEVTSTKQCTSLSKSSTLRKYVNRQLERGIQVSVFLRAGRTKCFLFLPLSSWQVKNTLNMLAD